MSDNNAIEKKKRGRPATGRAMDGSIFLRIPSGQKKNVKAVVKAFLEGLPAPVPAAVVASASVDDSRQSAIIERMTRELARLKEEMALKAKETAVVVQAPAPNQDVMALLNSNEELTKEVEGLKRALERCSMASDDQKTHWWRAKYNALVAEVTAKHGSAEFGQ